MTDDNFGQDLFFCLSLTLKRLTQPVSLPAPLQGVKQ